MEFIDPLCWKLKKFIVREVTHAHKGGAVLLAPYHRDIKTFRWTRLLSSWFCLSWHSVVRDLLCKTIGEDVGCDSENINLFEVFFHSEIMKHVSSDLPSLIHWCVHLFMEWLSNRQKIYFTLPHETSCHICIFLIAHISTSPCLTCPIIWHITFSPKTLRSINTLLHLSHMFVDLVALRCTEISYY